MSLKADVLKAILAALPEGVVVVDGPYYNLAGKDVAYVAPENARSLRVRIQLEEV